MSGPLIVGKMLALGTGSAGIFLACAPGVVVAAASLCFLSSLKKSVKDQSPQGVEIKPGIVTGN
jgi:AAHS family 3-hydroxyphenylpropionic acid transporter